MRDEDKERFIESVWEGLVMLPDDSFSIKRLIGKGWDAGRSSALKDLEQIAREADTSHVSNLEMLVVRLAMHIAKLADGDSKLADQAFDYIKRKGVSAGTDILRFDMQKKTESKEAGND